MKIHESCPKCRVALMWNGKSYDSINEQTIVKVDEIEIHLCGTCQETIAIISENKRFINIDNIHALTNFNEIKQLNKD